MAMNGKRNQPTVTLRLDKRAARRCERRLRDLLAEVDRSRALDGMQSVELNRLIRFICTPQRGETSIRICGCMTALYRRLLQIAWMNNGSTLRLQGDQRAMNYRRISVEVAMMDEATT